jgi:hypothetical protein
LRIGVHGEEVGTVTPEEVRERCQKVLGNVVHGLHPLHGLGGTDGITLGMFIADTYTTWVTASRPRTAANTLEKLHRLFRTWYPEPLTAITVERIESWKARRLNEGRSGTTALRDLFTLSSVLRRAVKAGVLTENPVRRVDKPRIDRRGTVRLSRGGIAAPECSIGARCGTAESAHIGEFTTATPACLVQRGVPLNTVRDLLGHSSVQMSLRYARLAPDQRREAVDKLNETPVLALTLRLPWESPQAMWRYPIDLLVEREGLEPSTPAL